MFDPTVFGFTEVVPKSSGRTAKGYSYLRTGLDKNGRRGLTLHVDAETASLVKELFGDRVNVAVNDDCKLLLYKGRQRKLSKGGGANGAHQMALDTIATKALECLGPFVEYKLDAKVYAGGQAVTFRPVERTA